MAIILSSLITSLFSAYLLFSYVQLRMKAAVTNMRSSGPGLLTLFIINISDLIGFENKMD
jgi:hypothetical protein